MVAFGLKICVKCVYIEDDFELIYIQITCERVKDKESGRKEARKEGVFDKRV